MEIIRKQQLEVLDEARNYMEKLEKGICLTIECTRTKRKVEGYSLLSQIAEGLEWLCDAFVLTQGIQNNKINTETITNMIQQIIEGIENEDLMLISEVLEYELLDLVFSWKKEVVDSLSNYENEIRNQNDE